MKQEAGDKKQEGICFANFSKNPASCILRLDTEL